MRHGPLSCGAVNQTPVCTAYHESGATWMIGRSEFAT
jgi:hypothetical protein